MYSTVFPPSPLTWLFAWRAAVPAAATTITDVTPRADRSTDDEDNTAPKSGMMRVRTGYRRSPPRENGNAPATPANLYGHPEHVGLSAGSSQSHLTNRRAAYCDGG
ncbi:MAG: hypothetical protein ACR2M3_19215 [Thermomicrobiales bacterium]